MITIKKYFNNKLIRLVQDENEIIWIPITDINLILYDDLTFNKIAYIKHLISRQYGYGSIKKIRIENQYLDCSTGKCFDLIFKMNNSKFSDKLSKYIDKQVKKIIKRNRKNLKFIKILTILLLLKDLKI